MTSRELVVILAGIVRRTPPDQDAVVAVLTFLSDEGVWFARQVETAQGITVEKLLRKGRRKKRLFQALLPFDAGGASAS